MSDEPTIEELIERSSLGTPGAKALRARTPPDVAEAIVARAETAYRPPADVPHGWEGRTAKHFDPPSKITTPATFSVKVVGCSFSPGYPGNYRALASMAGSENKPPIVLRHDPENPHDTNAVQVIALRPAGERMLGHLPRALAPRIAGELDAGRDWRVIGYEVLEDPRHLDNPGLSIVCQRFDS